MSDNGELILGLSPPPENATDSNGGQNSSQSADGEGELITGDVGEAGVVEFKHEPEDSPETSEEKPILFHINGQLNAEELAKSVPAGPSSIIVSIDSVTDSLPASTNIVDFINRAGSELTGSPSLDDEDDAERPAKKRRKTLPKGTFQCAECRTLCENFDSYASHMNTHSAVPLYTCPKCLYIFQEKSLFDAHVAQTCRAAGNSKDKECAVCRKTFKYDSHLREHIICMHNKTPLFSCPICGQNITSWRRSIDRHMANHSTQLKCPSCGVKADNAEALDVHSIEAGEKHLWCRACDFTSNIRKDFFSHANTHIPKADFLEPMVCFKCGQRFQRTSEFNNHVRLFCQYRDTPMDVSGRPEVGGVQTQTKQPTVQLPIPEGINEVNGCSPEETQEVIHVANDVSKQIITLPEGMNNNALIPITLTTGGDDLGQGLGPNTTYIIIPQMLLMPNAGGTQEGAGEMIVGGQNDQLIYVECIKPDQAGMMPMFEVPADKNGQENVFANQQLQSVLQALQQNQAGQPLQTMEQVQQQLQQLQQVQQLQQIQQVQQLQQMQQVQQIQQVQVQQVQQVQHEQPAQAVQVCDHESVIDIKEEPVVEEKYKVPVTTVPSSAAAPQLSVQSVYSLALNTSPSAVAAAAAPIDSAAQSNAESGGPPALVCSVCNEVLKDSETYESHVKQHDKSKAKPKANVIVQKKGATSFKCEQCGQGFAAKHHLEQHTITFHSDVAGIVCPVCRVGMATERTSLNEHLAKAHNLRVEPSGKLTDCSSGS